MSDYERSIRRSLAYLSGVADAIMDTHPSLGESIANVVCDIEVDVFEALAEIVETPEQSTETQDEDAVDDTVSTKEIWRITEGATASCEIIGSASEVSDEAVRAAGGTPEYSFGPRTS